MDADLHEVAMAEMFSVRIAGTPQLAGGAAMVLPRIAAITKIGGRDCPVSMRPLRSHYCPPITVRPIARGACAARKAPLTA
jgi:hypothetical protein